MYQVYSFKFGIVYNKKHYYYIYSIEYGEQSIIYMHKIFMN